MAKTNVPTAPGKPSIPGNPKDAGVASSSAAVSLFMVYQFLKRLVTPFNQWPAYQVGIIDEKGNIILKAKDRHTLDQKRSFSKFDLLVLKIKKILSKLPGGDSKMATYAAALYLVKEDWKQYSEEELESDNIITEKYILSMTKYLEEEGEVPANNIGAGKIAGGGYNGPDDVKVSSKAAARYKLKNKRKQI